MEIKKVRQVIYYPKHMAIMASVCGELEGQVIGETLQCRPLIRIKTSTRLELRIRVSTNEQQRPVGALRN